jgi:hypothetical protein
MAVCRKLSFCFLFAGASYVFPGDLFGS